VRTAVAFIADVDLVAAAAAAASAAAECLKIRYRAVREVREKEEIISGVDMLWFVCLFVCLLIDNFKV